MTSGAFSPAILPHSGRGPRGIMAQAPEGGGGLDAYDCRRPNGAPRFRCRACQKDFSITSGTLFASHKLPLRLYLAAIAIFCNEVKGKSMLAMSRDLGLSYKAAFVLCHKMREAMAAEMRARVLGGEGKVASVDGAYFGGYVKPANLRTNRRDRRLAEHQTGKRRVVVIIREHGGDSLPAVFKSEAAATSFIRKHVAPGTVVNADEANSWDSLHARFEMRRIDHGEAYSLDGACTNWRKSISAAFAVARWATTTISAARTCSGSLRKPRGAKTAAAWPTASK
jgi:hypothetical protein